MVDISKSFATRSEAIADFFKQPGVSFYIPLYQRPYSWDEENVSQLMEDIRHGVGLMLEKDNEDAIHFLGTVILMRESQPHQRIEPKDPKALPPTIFNVIDGQQRISTMSLLSCVLYRSIYELMKKIPENDSYDDLREIVTDYQKNLLEMFSVDLGRGAPARKPVIIRGSVDVWTFDGADDNYQSDLSFYIADFIRNKDNPNYLMPQRIKGTLISKNIKEMNDELAKVLNAHLVSSEGFPNAWEILKAMLQENLWIYQRPKLKEMIEGIRVKVEGNVALSIVEKTICSLVQIFSFCYYTFNCCCITLIEPVTENRAFDMFQSLNATGTPLTALETFKPLVVNFLDTPPTKYKDSKSEEYLNEVESLMVSAGKSASAKSKLTDNYLTVLALARNGSKTAAKFSDQRKWLNATYEGCPSAEQKEEFIRQMGDLASYETLIAGFKPNGVATLPGLETLPEIDRNEATLSVLYLKDAGHKMANTILSRFHALTLRGMPSSTENFASACRAVASYFTLWRSALPNAGLDETYRKLLQDHASWIKSGTELDIGFVKKRFKDDLASKGVGTKDTWMAKARQYLRFDNVQKVCKFALFLASHDTIPDLDNPGLMKLGVTGSNLILTPDKWKSEDFKSIEHIAPRKPSLVATHAWDASLYGEANDFEQIGNLVLLPTSVNSSASNKSWKAKLIYYRHLAEQDPEKLADLAQEAQDQGVALEQTTIELLKKTSIKRHMESIISVGTDGVWDKSMVEKRTERICSILWERMYLWLT
jgi:hypothetical protein